MGPRPLVRTIDSRQGRAEGRGKNEDPRYQHSW